jgi:threonine synthase
MRYYSTNNTDHLVGLKEAVISGLAPDQGLYMPEKIPAMSPDFFKRLPGLSLLQIGEEVLTALFGEDLSPEQIHALAAHTLTFDAPLVEVEKDVYSLELFHGPTLAFKDFGARFCSKLMSLLLEGDPRKVRVLVATSGDTGSAVANGFLGVVGVEVVILYPKGKVSELQEKQFTTLGQNITALEVEGAFDDCQALVKRAFLDKDLNQEMLLTSANSINIARWIPQCLYYFYALAQLPASHKPVAVSVPSGNFGNIGAGILAERMGLPIAVFLASTNLNKPVPDYLEGNEFLSQPSVPTISNSMDVGNPSNFYRLLALYGNDAQLLRQKVKGYYFDDKQTKEAMQQVKAQQGYTMDPHGAVGYLGLKKFMEQHADTYTGIFLETAHPAKFRAVVEETLQIPVPLPARLEAFQSGQKQTIAMDNDFEAFKNFLFQTV